MYPIKSVIIFNHMYFQNTISYSMEVLILLFACVFSKQSRIWKFLRLTRKISESVLCEIFYYDASVRRNYKSLVAHSLKVDFNDNKT